MKKKFSWIPSQSSGSFFLVMLSAIMQGQFYKTQSAEFWHQLVVSSVVTTCILLFLVVVMHLTLCPNPLPPEKLEKLIKMQEVGIIYSSLPGMFLFLILVYSCPQYLLCRNESQLNYGQFFLSAGVAISLGFFARYVSSYLFNRRLNAAKQLSSTPHSFQ